MLISGAEIKLPNTGVLMSRTGSDLPDLAAQRPSPAPPQKDLGSFCQTAVPWVRSAKMASVLPETVSTK